MKSTVFPHLHYSQSLLPSLFNQSLLILLFSIKIFHAEHNALINTNTNQWHQKQCKGCLHTVPVSLHIKFNFSMRNMHFRRKSTGNFYSRIIRWGILIHLHALWQTSLVFVLISAPSPPARTFSGCGATSPGMAEPCPLTRPKKTKMVTVWGLQYPPSLNCLQTIVIGTKSILLNYHSLTFV